MLQKTMVALVAATACGLLPQVVQAGDPQLPAGIYGGPAQPAIGAIPGFARGMGLGLGLQSNRFYYSDEYPYYIYFRSGPNTFAPGCYLIRRPVLTPDGWRPRVVEVCD